MHIERQTTFVLRCYGLSRAQIEVCNAYSSASGGTCCELDPQMLQATAGETVSSPTQMAARQRLLLPSGTELQVLQAPYSHCESISDLTAVVHAVN